MLRGNFTISSLEDTSSGAGSEDVVVEKGYFNLVRHRLAEKARRIVLLLAVCGELR
jgi:hypothetical protein